MNVRIISDGTDAGTRVLNEEGAPIRGIRAIKFSAAVDEINEAAITLSFVQIDSAAKARFYVEGREVARIIYADGSEADFT